MFNLFRKTFVATLKLLHLNQWFATWGRDQGRIKAVWGPWLKLYKRPFRCIYKAVVNREKDK